jgi:hypothetical protein
MAITYERAKRGAGELGPLAMDVVAGGAGATVGLFAAKYLGDMVEGYIKPDPVSSSDKIIAWVGNAVPKGILAVLLAKYVPEMVGRKDELVGTVASGTVIGVAGSIGLDVVERLTNNGMPGKLMLNGNRIAEERVQALLKENSALKQNIQRLSSSNQLSQPVNVTVAPRPQPAMIAQPVMAPQPVTVAPQPYITVPPQPVRVEPPPNRPLEKKYQFTSDNVPGVQYEKRPLEKKYQFTGDVINPSVLATGFGFHV